VLQARSRHMALPSAVVSRSPSGKLIEQPPDHKPRNLASVSLRGIPSASSRKHLLALVDQPKEPRSTRRSVLATQPSRSAVTSAMSRNFAIQRSFGRSSDQSCGAIFLFHAWQLAVVETAGAIVGCVKRSVTHQRKPWRWCVSLCFTLFAGRSDRCCPTESHQFIRSHRHFVCSNSEPGGRHISHVGASRQYNGPTERSEH
jgi:hypothetical protein